MDLQGGADDNKHLGVFTQLPCPPHRLQAASHTQEAFRPGVIKGLTVNEDADATATPPGDLLIRKLTQVADARLIVFEQVLESGFDNLDRLLTH